MPLSLPFLPPTRSPLNNHGYSVVVRSLFNRQTFGLTSRRKRRACFKNIQNVPSLHTSTFSSSRLPPSLPTPARAARSAAEVDTPTAPPPPAQRPPLPQPAPPLLQTFESNLRLFSPAWGWQCTKLSTTYVRRTVPVAGRALCWPLRVIVLYAVAAHWFG